MAEKKYTAVLSIDGGGIRGIIPVSVLAVLEKIISDKIGQTAHIADYFDLVAGTSTGGIITLGLLRPSEQEHCRPKFKAEELIDFYFQEGPHIFKSSLSQKIKAAGGLLDEKYPNEGIEKALQRVFGDLWLSDLLKPCLITAYDIKRSQVHLFTQHDARKNAAYDFLVWQVARATSAAPTYFECALVESRTGVTYPLIDGGVFANNPAMCAYAEVRTHFPSPNRKEKMATASDMLFLSLGTGISRKQYDYKEVKSWGLASWVRPVLDMMMAGVSDTTHYQMMKMFEAVDGAEQYVRINPVLTSDIDAGMDNASPANMKALKEIGIYTAEQHYRKLEVMADLLLANRKARSS